VDDTGRVVPIPHLNADEIQILLHGLHRLDPFDGPNLTDLDTFLPDEVRLIVRSLSTALHEALYDARR
jgi:hypothetical protein